MKPSISEMHQRAPLCAAFVDEMRAAFGEVKVTYVSEGHVRLGKPTQFADIERVRYLRTKKEGKKVTSSVVEFDIVRRI